MKRYGLILFSIPVVVFLIIRFGFGFNGLYGQDSHEYYRYSNELISSFQSGNSPGSFFWPLAYPLFGAFFGYLFGDSLFVLQLISVLSLSISGILIFNTLKLKMNESYAFWLVLLIITTSGYLIRSSQIVMSDALSLMAISVVIYFYEKLKDNYSLLNIAAFAAGCTLSIMTRYPSVLLLIPFILLVGLNLIRERKYLGILISLLVFLVIVSPHIILRWETVFDFMGHGWLVNWSFMNFFQNAFDGNSGKHLHMLPNILFVLKPLFHPGFVSVVTISWLLIKKEDIVSIYCVGILLYLLFMAGVGMQNTRFLILSMPLITMILYQPFSRLLKRINNYQKLLFGVLILNSVLIFFAMRPVYYLNKMECTIANELIAEDYRKVYSFGIDVAMKSYLDNTIWLDMYSQQIDEPIKGAYVLFNEPMYIDQWKDEVLFDNWRMFKKSGLMKVKTLSYGWCLYEFK